MNRGKLVYETVTGDFEKYTDRFNLVLDLLPLFRGREIITIFQALRTIRKHRNVFPWRKFEIVTREEEYFSSTKPSIRLRSPIDHYSFVGILKKRLPSTRRKFASHGISVVKAASLDKVSGGIRPGGLVESEKLPTDVRKRAMEAVDECGRRVTVGDVSSRAGLKVTEAQKALQALAVDTVGTMKLGH